MMQHFIDAIRVAVTQNNWYAALSLALTMPDICGRLENPLMDSQARFVHWYNRYLLNRYQSPVGHDFTVHTFLSGNDCYALRCAFLHQGEFGIDDQRARQALECFRFKVPHGDLCVHMNQYDNVLELQVDRFCLDVCEAVEEWEISTASRTDIQNRIANLASIE